MLLLVQQLSFYFVCILGPLQESAVWIDESQTVRANLDHGRTATAPTLKEEEDPLGISDEGDRSVTISYF